MCGEFIFLFRRVFSSTSALKLIGIGKVTNTFSHNHSYDIAIIFNYISPLLGACVRGRRRADV